MARIFRIVLSVVLTILCLLIAVWLDARHAFRQRDVISVQSSYWTNITGLVDYKIDSSLRQGQFLCFTPTLTSGTLELWLSNEAGEKIPIGFNRLSDEYKYIVVIDDAGTYIFHYDGREAELRMDIEISERI